MSGLVYNDKNSQSTKMLNDVDIDRFKNLKKRCKICIVLLEGIIRNNLNNLFLSSQSNRQDAFQTLHYHKNKIESGFSQRGANTICNYFEKIS